MDEEKRNPTPTEIAHPNDAEDPPPPEDIPTVDEKMEPNEDGPEHALNEVDIDASGKNRNVNTAEENTEESAEKPVEIHNPDIESQKTDANTPPEQPELTSDGNEKEKAQPIGEKVEDTSENEKEDEALSSLLTEIPEEDKNRTESVGMDHDAPSEETGKKSDVEAPSPLHESSNNTENKQSAEIPKEVNDKKEMPEDWDDEFDPFIIDFPDDGTKIDKAEGTDIPVENDEEITNEEPVITEDKTDIKSQNKDETLKETEKIEDKKLRKTKNFSSFIIAGVGVILVILICISILLFFKTFNLKNPNTNLLNADQQTENHQEIPEKKRYSLKHHSIIEQKLAQLERMINNSLTRQEAVKKLMHQYIDSNHEIEDEIVEEIRSKGILTYKTALGEKWIELNLLTIQRREAYIRELDQLLEKMIGVSEELIYIMRATQIDLKMEKIIEGLNSKILVRNIDNVIEKYNREDDKLTIYNTDDRSQPLKTVWQRISNKYEKNKNDTDLVRSEEKKNRTIWNEICSGNFSRTYKMTTLTPQVAKCLSEWRGKELFLGKLIRLTPHEAKYLSKWKGRWLSLNGITWLSPETAKYLSQWQGDTLSLNGLKGISPEAAFYLSNWKGKILEFVGIKEIEKLHFPGKKLYYGNKVGNIS